MLQRLMEKMTRQSAYLSEIFPVFSIEENKVVLKDGRVAMGWAVESAEMESWCRADYEFFNTQFQSALKVLPVKSVVQKMDIYFDKEYQTDGKDMPYFESKMHAHFLDRLVLMHNSYLFVSFAASPNGSTTNPVSTFFAAKTSPLANPFHGIEERLNSAETLGEEFVNGLRSGKDLRFKRLKDDQLEQLYLQYFNLEFDSQPTDMNRQMSNGENALIVGENKVNLITLKGQGAETYDSVSNHLGVESPMVYALAQYLQFPHILTTCVQIEDTPKELKSLDSERKLNSGLEFLSTQDNDTKAAELGEFTAVVRANNLPLVNMNVSVTVFEVNDRTRKMYTEKIVSAFREIQGCETVVESFDTAALFFANAPGNAFQNYRWLLVAAPMAASYFHFITSYQGDKTGELLCDRFRNPVRVNLFNTALNNQNCVAVGPSGSGKSYSMGNFMTQRFEKNARQIIIDVGCSYKKLLSSLNAGHFEETYFEYDPQNPIAFYPFLIEKIQGKYALTSDKSNFILNLLSIIWKGAKNAPLKPAERSVFKLLIPDYFAFLNQHPDIWPGISSFYEWVQAQNEAKKGNDKDYDMNMKYFQIDEFLVVLRPFISGEYLSVLNAKRELDISEQRLVCFDMEKIKTDPTLYPIVALLITELALDQIRKFPDEVKYIYLDEAWSMLSGSLSEFIEGMYRTVRKNNGSVCIITQGTDEIVASDIGTAIINNADTKIILNHTNKEVLARVQVHLGLTDHELELLTHMRVAPTYRELFIKQGTRAKVYVLETSPHMDAVMTSKPVERNYLRALIGKFNGRVDFATDQYVENKLIKKGVFDV